jgi:GT2 family glycosyltransferase
MTTGTRVGVVIPCHTEKRWDQLRAAVSSALGQTPAPTEVVVVVDHNEVLYDLAKRGLPEATVLANAHAERGVSGNRNTGAFHLDTPLIALLDDDAYAHPGWLAGLLAPFEDPEVCGTGGAISPAWETDRPAWVPDEFLWAWGGSYTGMPTVTSPVRNVWSASMAVRRDVFEAVGGFRVGFGKVGDRSRPEDTDLCLRMSEASGGHWMYVPDAVIDHPVPADKATLGYFLTRTYNEGRGKVELARLNNGKESLGSERDYLRRTLPRGVARGVADTVRGRGLANAARAGAILVGMAVAATGGAVETVHGRRAGKTAPATPETPTAAPETLTAAEAAPAEPVTETAR